MKHKKYKITDKPKIEKNWKSYVSNPIGGNLLLSRALLKSKSYKWLAEHYTGQGIRIAVIDSGLGKNPLLADQESKIIRTSFVNNESPYDDPINHGTFVGSLFLGRTNAFMYGYPTIGLCPDVDKYYHCKIIGNDAHFTIDGLTKALEYLLNLPEPPHFINMSIGAGMIPESMQQNDDIKYLNSLFDECWNRRIRCIAAAGNAQHYWDSESITMVYPASHPHVESVGSIDFNDRPSTFSSRGDVDACAYGEDIIGLHSESGYMRAMGTSFASPYHMAFKTCFASRLLANGNKIDNVMMHLDTMLKLEGFVTDIAPAGKDKATGVGLLRYP